jgi:hypothetical protein
MQTFQTFVEAGSTVSPSEFLAALDVSVPSILENAMDSSRWAVYQCAKPDTRVFSVLLTNYLSGPLNDEYPQLEASLQPWERTFVFDVAPLLFPNVERSVFAGEWYFVDTSNFETRRHTRLPVDGVLRDVGYYFIASELLIGNDLECLEEVRSLLFDVSA